MESEDELERDVDAAADEMEAGLKELDEGRGVPHKDVSNWLRSWGRRRERKAPRA